MRADDLIAAYGSPLYVYELTELDRAAADLRAAAPTEAGLYYSLKANPHPDLVARLRAAGCRAEVSSPGEVAAALAAGFAGADMLYTGPAKTSGEIDVALRAGVRLFSVESPDDFARVGRAAELRGDAVDCLVRVNIATAGASGLRMTGAGSRFGTAAEAIVEAPERFTGCAGARAVGLHFFSLSNAGDEDALIDQALLAVETARRVCDAGLPLSILDLGGGFATPYARPGQRPVYRRFSERVSQALDRNFPGWRAGTPAVVFESGRYLVGSCGSLVTTATERKTVDDQTFILLDSGINHLGGLGGLGRLIPAAMPAPTSSAAGPSDHDATLAGPLCTPADILGRRVPANLAVGAPLIIPHVGAYGLTASLIGFLSRPAPIEVVLDGGEVVSVSQLRIDRVQIAREAP